MGEQNSLVIPPWGQPQSIDDLPTYIHSLMQRTSPVRLTKPHLQAALSTTRTVIHRLKACSITKTLYLRSGKLVCADTTLIQA